MNRNAHGAYAEVIRHLSTAPIDQTRKWVHRSVTRAPGVEISVIASRDSDERTYPRPGMTTVVHALHLSLCAMTADAYTELPEADLLAWGRGVFGDSLQQAWVEPPARLDDPFRLTPASGHTTHLQLFLDGEGQPTAPVGETFSLRPWAARALVIASR